MDWVDGPAFANTGAAHCFASCRRYLRIFFVQQLSLQTKLPQILWQTLESHLDWSECALLLCGLHFAARRTTGEERVRATTAARRCLLLCGEPDPDHQTYLFALPPMFLESLLVSPVTPLPQAAHCFGCSSKGLQFPPPRHFLLAFLPPVLRGPWAASLYAWLFLRREEAARSEILLHFQSCNSRWRWTRRR